ncbi:hypothetical protein [Nocardia xishanensis]|uniref:hypothetical protein n=1 Tax=Nocardia xishanensis TaxID=238964 RepID=UPI000B02D6E4|nr:hypothetical protein [Nocardia xishanensis]
MTPVQVALLWLAVPAALFVLACVVRHLDVKFALLMAAVGALVACLIDLIEVAA